MLGTVYFYYNLVNQNYPNIFAFSKTVFLFFFLGKKKVVSIGSQTCTNYSFKILKITSCPSIFPFLNWFGLGGGSMNQNHMRKEFYFWGSYFNSVQIRESN